MRLRAIALRMGSAMLLAACSASDGGGGESTPDLVITPEDADVTAAEVMRGLVISTDFADVSTSPGSVNPSAVALAGASESGGVAVAVVVPPTTRPCAQGGSVTIQGDVAFAGTLTAGDRIDADFAACEQASGFILNGALDFGVLGFTGDLDDVFRLEVDARFTDLAMNLEGQPATAADGRVDVAQDTRSPQLELFRMSGGPITFSEGAHTLTLTLFDNTLDRNVSNQNYELIGSGSMISSLLGNARVTYQVTDELAGNIPGEPSEGELLMGGADGATILLTAQGTNVELEIDLDGEDGPLEPETQTLSWAALYAAQPTPPAP